MFTVHPRLRGELPAPIAAVAVMDGSSPLTRGTPRIEQFIPRTNTVHPRLRGELRNPGKPVNSGIGSSPLTRGTPSSADLLAPALRFIPAYAGNS